MSLTDLDLLARHVEEPVDLFRIVKGATRGAPASWTRRVPTTSVTLHRGASSGSRR